MSNIIYTQFWNMILLDVAFPIVQPIYGVSSAHFQNTRVQGQWHHRRVNTKCPFTISPFSHQGGTASLSPLYLMVLKVLVTKGKSLPSRKVAWNWEMRSSSGHLGHYMSLKSSQRRKRLCWLRILVPFAMRNLGYLDTFGPMRLHLESRAHQEFLHLKENANILTEIRPPRTQVHQNYRFIPHSTYRTSFSQGMSRR